MSASYSSSEDDLRLRAAVQRLQLASLMNATKWRELFEAIDNLKLTHEWMCRHKRIDSDKPTEFSAHQLDPDFQLLPYRWMEWLELDPRVRERSGVLLPSRVVHDFTSEVCRLIQSMGVPLTFEGGMLRVWGYARPGRFPELVQNRGHGRGESVG